MKTAVRSSVVCIAILLIVSLTAMAASKNGVSTTNNGHKTIATKAASKSVPLQQHFPAGLSILYDNASSYPLGVYWCCEGYTISGSGSVVGAQFADGMPFTPSVNATVTHIGVGVGFVTGDNEVTVSLNADSGGLPGASLGSFTPSNLSTFGDCCATEVGSITGVPVTAGTQYWVVVSTTTATSSTWAAWNDNDTNETETQPTAFQDAGVWGASEGIPGVFGVAGTVQ